MRPHVLITLVAMLAVASATAQDDIDALMPNPASRLVELSRAYAAHPDNVEHMYNLALFYFDNSNPMRNLPLAMKYIVQAEARHVYLLENNKNSELTRLLKRNIDLPALRIAKRAIQETLRSTLLNSQNLTDAELDEYMEIFANDRELSAKIRQMRIANAYAATQATGSTDAYYAFSQQYKGIDLADQAERILGEQADRLLKEARTPQQADSIGARYSHSPSIQRAVERRKSHIAYLQARSAGTIAAYETFLAQYPSSDDQLQAREQLDMLRDALFTTSRSTRKLAEYVENHPDNPLADSAMAEIRRRIYEQHDVEAARIYIDKFAHDEYYGDVFAHFYTWHAQEGNGAPLRRFAARYPDFLLPRALESDMERAAEIDRIKLTDNFKEARYEQYANYVRRLTGKKIAIVPLQRMIQELLASGRYVEAQARVWEFDFCFDDSGHDEYRELYDMLGTPTPRDARATLALNGEFDIENPTINSADGCLYFTKVQKPLKDRICRSTKVKGKWGAPQALSVEGAPDGGVRFFGFSPDGQRMLLGCEGDIWIADREGEKWRVSEIPPYPVNTDYIEADASILPDGSGMLFVSDRPGGQNLQLSGDYFHGDTALASDIYFVPLTSNGWGEVENLGFGINTPYSERSPRMSRNMRTLYYITDSRGLGFGDIYVSTRNATDGWTSWSAPRNLGLGINSGYRETSVSLDKDESHIIFASNVGGGHSACFSAPVNHDTTWQGSTYKLPIHGGTQTLTRIRLMDMTTQTLAEQMVTFAKGNEVVLPITRNRVYAVLADMGDRLAPGMRLAPSNQTKLSLRGYTFAELVAMDKPLPLPIADFDQEGNPTLITRMQMEQIAQFAAHHPDCTLEVVISVGGRDDRICYETSLARGRALRDCLISAGVDEVSVSAYGNAINNTDVVAIRFGEHKKLQSLK